ncbi:ATP-binding cassette domain-containing protein [Gordonia pseudamarae]|uniref:ATP-binding cassette domain-containing protein n=2 Tax=Gordoniaceae TaxID=85026 RepID=A0ABX6IG35_9ACTN|nr:ATP-binding cassette domain-containing protein [Gordonia sp. (in: high G+C Gram-positive bacteria)]QHN25387.1 ATP-binding cassette domain-containing protein [Gordonia pseudamarae]QHN34319.1 ATP-binding cassette domain-containing protein [Gordonia pseudamarae]
MSTPRASPPIDPRLLRYSPASRVYIMVTALLAFGTVVAIVVAAAMTASILSELVVDPARRSLSAQATHLIVLVCALLARVAMTFGHDRYAHRASATVIAELRARALDSLTDPARTSPRELLGRRDEASTVLLRGLDALTPYLSGYVPALILTVTVTPAVIGVIGVTDWPSALIIVLTIPLIPLFMILVGLMTRDRTERKLATMSRLTAQTLDLIAGLPTLRALGRARAQAGRVAELGAAHRRSTMSALRVAFLSGAILELLATLCVALVAVGIGVRLVHGDMSLYAGVLALVLAPEAYLPLRQVGSKFHDSADGLAAANEAFALIDPSSAASVPSSAASVPPSSVEVPPSSVEVPPLSVEVPPLLVEVPPLLVEVRGAQATSLETSRGDDAASPCFEAPRPRARRTSTGEGEGSAVVVVEGLGVWGRDGWAPRGLSATIRAGRLTMLTGPNGSGKSTALEAIMGLLEPDEGRVVRADQELEAFRRRIAWLPQQPVVVPGTVAENLTLFADAARTDLDAAAAVTGFDEVLAGLPAGYDTLLGAGGVGLSAGQRQRLALVRVLVSSGTLLLLDEPTAHLDPVSADRVLTLLRERAGRGDAVVVVAHGPDVLRHADDIVEMPAVGVGIAGGGR